MHSVVVIIIFVFMQEIADKEVAALPRDSNYIRVRHRCALTSRPRGVVFKWRLSRIVWRHLADYNKLAGVQRAIW
jgi:small subunit ribosomal protein S14